MHIEYDDFGEYEESMEDLMVVDKKAEMERDRPLFILRMVGGRRILRRRISAAV